MNRERGVFVEMKIWLAGWRPAGKLVTRTTEYVVFMARKEGRIPVSSQDFLLSRSVARSIVIVVSETEREKCAWEQTCLSGLRWTSSFVVRRYVPSLAHCCTLHGKSRFIGLERCLAQFRKWLSLSRVETNTLGVIHPFSVPSDDDRTN